MLNLFSFGHQYTYPPTTTKEILYYDLRSMYCPIFVYMFGYTLLSPKDIMFQTFLLKDKAFNNLYEQIKKDINDNKPKEIWIGCEHGKHRSVALIEKLHREFPDSKIEHMEEKIYLI